jgi:hypothetical protein
MKTKMKSLETREFYESYRWICKGRSMNTKIRRRRRGTKKRRAYDAMESFCLPIATACRIFKMTPQPLTRRVPEVWTIPSRATMRREKTRIKQYKDLEDHQNKKTTVHEIFAGVFVLGAKQIEQRVQKKSLIRQSSLEKMKRQKQEQMNRRTSNQKARPRITSSTRSSSARSASLLFLTLPCLESDSLLFALVGDLGEG